MGAARLSVWLQALFPPVAAGAAAVALVLWLRRRYGGPDRQDGGDWIDSDGSDGGDGGDGD